MSISVQNRKILWGRSGNRCAFPGCNQELHQVIGQCGSTVIGEECHIEAQSGKGPRFNRTLTEKQINSFENLILFCPTHHRIVDENPEEYTVDTLKKMKGDHEGRVRRALEDKTEFDDLYYESVVTYIETMLDFDGWDVWTSYLLSADGPKCTEETQKSIDEIIQYILGRVWYGRYPDLEDAIKNFRAVLVDFDKVFHRHTESKNGWFFTERFYRIQPYDHVVADELLKVYEAHVFLVNNLVYELTRASNRICDLVRLHVNPSYRLAEGKLVSYDKCPEYRIGEYYPGLEEFEKICRTRDVYV